MKISLNWIKQFTDISLTKDELIERIGRQLGEIDEVVDLDEQYKGVVIARVASCQKHPDADKLSVCRLDDGGVATEVERTKDGLVEVVCGAPNVAEGMLVAWLPPGTVVPETYHTSKPFTLEARELRGVVSNGMIASAKELDLSDDHQGIVEVDIDAKPGESFAHAYDLAGDVIIDIENKMFTHRPDCFGILGVARELAGIQSLQFESPEWYKRVEDRIWKVEDSVEELPLDSDNQNYDSVPRFVVAPVSSVEVKPSPLQMQSYLMRVGIRPINNVVDITNFVMHLTGQPLHAYDYDKVKAKDASNYATIMARQARNGEKLTLINEKTIELTEDDIVISTKEHAVGLGGIMGGIDTEVDDSTKNIILECANFDMYAIRRSSMRHGIFSDAVTRFNKGQSPHQNDKVFAYALSQIRKLAGAQLAGPVEDYSENLRQNPTIEVGVEFINQRLGLTLSKKDIVSQLRFVEFDVTEEEHILKVTAPFWRTDLHIPEDIVEEVGRLVGYDQLPLVLPRRSIAPAATDPRLAFTDNLRNVMAGFGANEVLTYSFIHGDVLQIAGQNSDYSYQINNALSPELQYYRQSLTPSLLAHVHSNVKAGFAPFSIFEINKVHHKQHTDEIEPALPKEWSSLAAVCALDESDIEGAGFYYAKTLLHEVARKIGVEFHYHVIDHDAAEPIAQAWEAPFDRKRTAAVYLGDAFVGLVGEYRSKPRKHWKLPVKTAGFEVEVDTILKNIPHHSPYMTLSRYPAVQQDISLRVSSQSRYSDIWSSLQSAATQRMIEECDYEFEPLDIYQVERDASPQMSFRLHIVHRQRTLDAKEVNELLDTIASDLKKENIAERI